MEIGLHDTRLRQEKPFSKLPGFSVVQQTSSSKYSAVRSAALQ